MREGAPTPSSLFAVSEARRVARHAGATVFALLLTEPLTAEALAPIVRPLGLAGADKVLLGEAEGFDAPALDVTHGPAVQAIAERIPPLLLLFPAGGPGAELGPTLAARLGGAFAGTSDLILGTEESPLPDGSGRVGLRRWRANHSGYRVLDPVEIERPVVAILGSNGVPVDRGTMDVEIEVVNCSAPAMTTVSELSSEPDPFAALEQARTLVVVGSDVDPDLLGKLTGKLAPLGAQGVVVADGRAMPTAALASAAPSLVVAIGAKAPRDFGSPDTRVALILPTGAASTSPAGPGVDAVWTVAPGAPWDDELCAALATLHAAPPEPARS